MTDQGANTAAGKEPGYVWRLSLSIIGTDAGTLGKIQAATTKLLDGSILDSNMHIVKDDAHPAALKK